MAAPPAKPSPSNQAIQQTATSGNDNNPPSATSATVQLKAPPSYSINDAAAASTAAPSQIPVSSAIIPSYTSSEMSESYFVAKQLLNEGNFEEALSIVEQELENTKAVLLSQHQEADFHPAIAPLHYLYGTTLLYSLEEAKDDGENAPAMTTMMPQTEEEEEEESKPMPTIDDAVANNPWAHLPETDADPVDPEAPTAAADDAEDMEIAWENFEVARHIIEKMLTDEEMQADMETKLKLDLAQIMLREGDLQRLNGRYTSAVQDYSSCLELRKAYLDKWDRKIADTQFNLGLTYLSSSSDLQKEVSAPPADVHPATPNAAVLAKEHCEKGIAAHVECAKTFGGIVAKLCGADPEALLSEVSTSKPSAAGFKTTGLDDDIVSVAVASQTLNILRKAVTTLVANSPPTDTTAANTVYDIQQVLDEIQETVDEAERAMDAVRQASEIRIQAQKQAAALNGPADGTIVSATEDGVTTSIGFGAISTAVSAPSTTLVEQPIMVIKKKKKRSADDEEEDSKPPAVPDVKRAKTELE
ncbi:hypothetical protein IV203_026141 [Nitzschia inconspicua]|uniref:Tetratricopeptide SHNi-TPR domain-containing protein n=1 Tax=Nitzschia inconspicua TaxID=303405 RepID=A0A9K3LL48_9STRA|nr:hypothetical protein IV203_026141 [Nitzschia inconspicua]